MQFLDYLSAHPWSLWLLAGALSLLLARRSQVDAWVEMHPRIGGVLKLLRGFGIDPWLLVQGLSLLVRGRLPDPPPVKSTRKLPPLVVIVLTSMLVGCASAKPIPSDPTQRAQYYADAVIEAVEAKERAKAVALKYEATADDGIRTLCSELVSYRTLLGLDVLAEVDAACKGYLSTPEPARLEQPEPAAPPDAPAPPAEPAPAIETPEAGAGSADA